MYFLTNQFLDVLRETSISVDKAYLKHYYDCSPYHNVWPEGFVVVDL